MGIPLRLLLVEDNLADAELVLRELRRSGFDLDYRRVDTERAYLDGLDAGLDLVLSDASLPQFSGMRALELLKHHRLDVPFILVSGTIGEELAVEAMKQGAVDYLLKDRLTRLGQSVMTALTQHRLVVEGKAATLALAHAEAKYRSLFENAVEGIYQRTRDGQFLTANPAFVRMIGFDSADELIAAGPVVLDHLWIDPAARTRFETLLEQRSLVSGIEMQLRRRDDSLIWVSVNARAIPDAHGTLRYEGTVQDISERKRAEEALRLSEEQFRQAQRMEAIGRLAGGIAHDFNNLLTVINVNVEAALANTPEGDRRRQGVEEIRDAADRAATLTRQLLIFSRKQVLLPRVLNLNAVVADTERMLHRLIGADIALVTTLAPDLGNICADPGQIEQLIMNLVVNSRDAMPDGGTITITTANAELGAGTNHNRLMPAGRCISLTVSDTGTGMDEETQRHLFEPFFTTKAVGKGTGLGLSTVYGVVQQAGGDILVSSALRRGTTFTIYLPRGMAAAPADAPPPVPASPAGGSEIILVTEDEENLRRGVERILSAAGYTVLSAPNGAAALKLAAGRDGPIDLLMTDIVMPHMNGHELAKQLTEARPGLKVLFTSGYIESTTVHDDLFPAGHYLCKPYHVADLRCKIREVLDEPSLAAL